MKRIFLWTLAVATSLVALGQTNVTGKYIDNPNFEARFAGWENSGMTFQTNASFKGKNGMVYMEKYVSQGSKVGSATSIKQTLVGLTPGTYTLVAACQNIQQGKDAKQTGAFLYAANEQVEVVDSAEYRVTFTVLQDKAEIGFKTQSCTGNWVCVDNFRLYATELDWEGVVKEMEKLITEAEGIVGDGVTGPALQTAIDQAKGLLISSDEQPTIEACSEAAKTLSRATLEYRISNGTGTVPKVTTWDFVPTGVTIALGRMTVSGSAKERGFCWSTEPNPTVLDNRSTRYFSNNGNIYCIEHLQPATVYYVRPYAMTTNYQVGYGEQVKIATLPESNMTTQYDNAGDEQTNFRIASAVNEVYWLYHHLTNVRGFNLNVHYVPGSGAGGGTADCSYGGWMRVSQNTPYQQTGTILHETNHGVGVGTTGEWYNNSNLRAETSRGLWLGPRANQVIQFLENSKTATLTGDNTHMWPYGINGAHEDSYNPENTILYYANAMTTHALHQDGLICSWDVGFATPAYVFQQMDNQKYFLTSEDADNVSFLSMTDTGILKLAGYDAEQSDNFAWYIGYDPKTSYYTFQNVATGRYLTYSSGFKSSTHNTPTSTDKFHLLPARQTTTLTGYTGTGYWITYNKGANALQAGDASISSKALDFSNAATSQRWLFLSENEMQAYRSGAVKAVMANLDDLLAHISQMVGTPHEAKDAEADVTTIDQTLTNVVEGIATAKETYDSPEEVSAAIATLQEAALEFLAEVKVSDLSQPIDLTWMLVNPSFDDGTTGWSTAGTVSYTCCEFYEKTFDLNQTTKQKVPAGTYELRVQAFQRPGAAADTYTNYAAGKDDVKTQIYLKSKAQKVKNIWAEAQDKSLGGSTSSGGGKVVPNNMLAASKWFAEGLYDNSVVVKTATQATMKLGIRLTTSVSKDWTIFDNFRLYYYGDYDTDLVTGVETPHAATAPRGTVFDLSGRRLQGTPHKGIYIINGKKVVK